MCRGYFAKCVFGVAVLLTLLWSSVLLSCQVASPIAAPAPGANEAPRPTNQTQHSEMATAPDVGTQAPTTMTMTAHIAPCLAGGSEGGDCSHSAQCASSHFCHPEKKSCAPFCRSKSYEKSEMVMDNCSHCMEQCGKVSSCQGFIEERAHLRAGRCAKSILVGHCPMCKDHCEALLNEMPIRFPKDQPSDQDFWITSYPKTGSTWVRHLITNMYLALHGETRPANFKTVDDLIPFIEDGKGWTSESMFRERTGLRMWKSHSPFHCDTFPCKGETVHRQGPSQCMCPNCAAKFRRVVYIYRDGYNTLASYFRFRLGLGHVKDSQSFAKFMNDRRMYPGVSWADHIRSWQHAEIVQQDLKIHWLRYEAMEESPETELKRLAFFLGLNATEESISFAINASSAKTMQDMEQREGGLNFFKLRYNRPHLKFVTAGSGELATATLWSGIPEEALAIWQLHNGPMMRCLGYPELPPKR
ncbi:unnamed protein product [Cladocopium goreaui]|uniref:Sulfotransferase family cytosolic 1B member 1 n=1 Tax=Cladocopium goreaui TaxID=2562237 RepID=A0A9P1D3H0_9DINO|nr:unnamed protein product [Cladocopium goreaui]